MAPLCDDAWRRITDPIERKRARDRIWYRRNKEKHYAYTRKRRLLAYKFVYEYLMQHPCVMCGNTDVRVLEFDHIDPSRKYKDISVMLNSGHKIDRIRAEIEKCQILCANCHRVKTFEERGYLPELFELEVDESVFHS